MEFAKPKGKKTAFLASQVKKLDMDHFTGSHLVKSTSVDFKDLKEIPKNNLEKIIKAGFILVKNKNIDLRSFYESVDVQDSVPNKYGYKIRFNSISRTKLYKELKKDY